LSKKKKERKEKRKEKRKNKRILNKSKLQSKFIFVGEDSNWKIK